jgi:hypothetical protein
MGLNKEQLKEARERSCYHTHLARILHEGALIWSECYECLDCGGVLVLQPFSVSDHLGVDDAA